MRCSERFGSAVDSSTLVDADGARRAPEHEVVGAISAARSGDAPTPSWCRPHAEHDLVLAAIGPGWRAGAGTAVHGA
jgi:hypothetical protein